MRKIIAIITLIIGITAQGWSAEPGSKGSWFGRIYGGAGDITSKKYCGMDLGMEVGYFPLRGLSVGLGIGWYTSKPNSFGRTYLAGVYRPDTWDYYYEPIRQFVPIKSDKLQNSFKFRAFVGYDVVGVVNGNSRVHFTPTLGVGVSQQRLFCYKFTYERKVVSAIDGKLYTLHGVVENEHVIRSKFEMDLGGRLDYDLPRGWAVGAYYRWYFLNEKMSCAGVSLTKSF